MNFVDRIRAALASRRLAAALAPYGAGPVIVLGNVPGGVEAGRTKGETRAYATAREAIGQRAAFVIAERGAVDAATLLAPGGVILWVAGASVSRPTPQTFPAEPAPDCEPCARKRAMRARR